MRHLEWENEVSRLHIKKVTVSSTWVIDSWDRGEAESGAAVEDDGGWREDGRRGWSREGGGA